MNTFKQLFVRDGATGAPRPAVPDDFAAGYAAFWSALKNNGAVLDGVADDAAALNAAFAEIAEAGHRRSIRFPGEVNAIKINSGLTYAFPQLSVDWNGIKVDASGMSSGTALTLTGQSVLPYNVESNTTLLHGLVLYGPNTDAGVVDGIKLGGIDEPGFSGHGSIDGVFIHGFRDNLVIDDNFFISQFRNLHSMFAHRYGLNYIGDTNTGESIVFFGGGFLDCENVADTAVGVYVPSAAAGPDLAFFGTSFSYCDVAFDVQCGVSSFVCCHFENETENPMGKIHYVGGRPSTLVTLLGGSVSHGTLEAGTNELAAGRPVMFLVNPAAGDRCAFISRAVRYGGFGKYKTKFVDFTGAGNVEIVVEDMVTDPQGGAVGRVFSGSSLIRNGGFEANITDGWTTTAGGATLTRDTSIYADANVVGSAGGIASLKIVAAAANTATLTQAFPVRPGRKVRVRGFARCDALSAGTLTAKLHWLDANGATISTSTAGTLSAAAATWAVFSAANDFKVPAGAVNARLELAANAFTGTGYFDDVEVWML